MKPIKLLEVLEGSGVEDLEAVDEEIAKVEKTLTGLKSIRRVLSMKLYGSKPRKPRAPKPPCSDAAGGAANVETQVLDYLKAHGPCDPADLRAELGLHHKTLTAALMRLRGRVRFAGGKLVSE